MQQKAITQEEYDAAGSWGIWSGIDLHACNPDTIRSAEKIKEFVIQVCEILKVNRFGECTIVHFGADPRVAGFSMVQLIETSLISGHFANESNNVYLDLFSCRYYDAEKALAFATTFFEAKDATIQTALRA